MKCREAANISNLYNLSQKISPKISNLNKDLTELRKQAMLIGVGGGHFLSVVTTRKHREIGAQCLKSQKLKQGDCEAECKRRGEKGNNKTGLYLTFCRFCGAWHLPQDEKLLEALGRRMTGSKNTSKGSPRPLFWGQNIVGICESNKAGRRPIHCPDQKHNNAGDG